MKIDNIQIENPFILAPMAGVTDLTFRKICKQYGASLVYTEMVSAKGLTYGNENTANLLQTEAFEKPVAVQLFGSEPSVLSEAVKRIEGYDFDIIDINMGCPVPKVVKNGEGSALMKNPKLVESIVRAVSKATKKAVTVKIRKGFDEANAPEIAKIAEDAGAKAVAVHGRTREQYYSGDSDLEIIAKVKSAVKIPVIGSGSIFTEHDAVEVMQKTNCDAVMIARGAMGNPFIFKSCNELYNTGKITSKPSIDEKRQVIINHCTQLAKAVGEYTAVREMRKHLSWYIKGTKGAAEMRGIINKTEGLDELLSIIESFIA